MESNSPRAFPLYLTTLLIELVCGVFRLIITIPIMILLVGIASYILDKFGIFVVDPIQASFNPEYGQMLLWIIFGGALLLAYANILVSILAYSGFGGGSLLTRFVMGARKPSSRELQSVKATLEQMAAGVDFPIRSYSKLYVIDSIVDYANLVGTTLYISSASIRANNLQALLAHEYGHIQNTDGSLILALRRLVFPPFSLFISGIRDFSTNRPAYRPKVREFDAMQIFYSLINNVIFFTFAFIGGGIGVWVMSWSWAKYFRSRDYLADSFGSRLGYRDALLSYLEANVFFDTAVPYMLGWHPASELRIDALEHPELYGIPRYEGVAAAPVVPITVATAAAVDEGEDEKRAEDDEEGEPVAETVTAAPVPPEPKKSSSMTARDVIIILGVIIIAYLLLTRTGLLPPLPMDPLAEAVGESTATPVATQVAEAGEIATDAVEPCTYSQSWFDEIQASSNDIPGLLAALDNEFNQVGNTQCSGDWTGSGFTVPAEAVFWTNLYEDRINNPGLTPIRAEGGWGVFYTAEPLAITSANNSGGRYIVLPEFVAAPYDCTAIAFASRALAQHGSGKNCWLQLGDGAVADIEFNDAAQVTYRTTSGGNDVYFYVANAGEQLDNVIGATIRPLPFVQAQYGGLEEVKAFEIDYHSPGGQWVTCLRDGVNNLALNAECEKAVAAFQKSRVEALVEYDAIYNQQGWCTLWEQLIADGLVDGGCPESVLQWGSEDVTSAGGTANLFTGLQMRATEDIEINYPACATFGTADYTGGTVEAWINNDYIATDLTLHPDSVFSIFFRCDNAWSPPKDTSLDELLAADVLAQIQLLGYDTVTDFAEAWGLLIGDDMANGEVAANEIATCPGETNGCVRITRETNASGAVEFAFDAKNPDSCQHDGYRREPGGVGQTGVPPGFEGMLEGVTIRRCLAAGGTNNGDGRECIGKELGPFDLEDHYFEAPVIVTQLWRQNGNSPWGSGEVTTVVQNSLSIRGAGGNAWAYPAADCLEVAKIHMQDGANIRGSTVVTPEELRAAGMID